MGSQRVGQDWATNIFTFSHVFRNKSGMTYFCNVNEVWLLLTFSSVQSLSCVWLFVTPWTAARQASLIPSRTPRVHPNPCPSSQWCHPTISSSVIPFSACPQSFPVSGSFQMSQLFTSGGQSVGVSASTLVLPMNTEDWSLLKMKAIHAKVKVKA